MQRQLENKDIRGKHSGVNREKGLLHDNTLLSSNPKTAAKVSKQS